MTQATFIFNLYNDFAKMYLGRAPISQQGFAIQFRTQNTNGSANLSLFIIENTKVPPPHLSTCFQKGITFDRDSALIWILSGQIGRWGDGWIDGGDGFHRDPYKGKVSPVWRARARKRGRGKEIRGENGVLKVDGFAYRKYQKYLREVA